MTGATLQQDWTDKRRYLWLLSTLTMLLPLGAIGLVEYTGLALFWWFGPIFVFIGIPILDHLLGEETENPPEAVVPHLEQDNYYRVAVWIAVIFQYWAFLVAVQVAATAALPWYSYLGLAITTGTAMGIAINTAHELGHKTNRFERGLAKLALAPVFYGHFFVEHNRGHHVRVSTPEDPASSRFGESFYRFLPRVVFGSLRSAWELEATRLHKEGKPVWHWQNHNLQAWSMSVVLVKASARSSRSEVSMPFEPPPRPDSVAPHHEGVGADASAQGSCSHPEAPQGRGLRSPWLLGGVSFLVGLVR